MNPPAVPQATPLNPTVPTKYQNPYAEFGDLSVVAGILTQVTTSQIVINSLKVKGVDDSFQVTANNGPILNVTATSPTASGAIRDTNLIIDEIRSQLLALQTRQGTDPQFFITLGTVVGADQPKRVYTGTARLLLIVGGLGTACTLASALLAESVSRRRADRRVQRTAEPEAQPA